MPSRRRPVEPESRALRVYAFDPSRPSLADDKRTIKIPYERLRKGPIGQRVSVIDYDASNRCYYEAVDLEDHQLVGQHGLFPSESDPRFHQQMVYAVVMETIRRFELALGRPFRWRSRTGTGDSPTLRVFPHAMQEANAYYDPRLNALLFGYFPTSQYDYPEVLPGETIFTCLSQDIVIHESTHAILDSIRDHFDEPTGADSAAFHEGFADIMALLQHFSFRDTLVDTIQRTGGLIHHKRLAPDINASGGSAIIRGEVSHENPLVGLARQFGEATGNRGALRSALGSSPDPGALRHLEEPHKRGAIFVAAVFDAFFSIFVRKTRDLFRIAYPDGRAAVPNFLHHDLAVRLADHAAATATTIQKICIRALDYCPPVDVTFGDFLRALVTADRGAVLDDAVGYRTSIIESFRARGIKPRGVRSYSEDELAWPEYRGEPAPNSAKRLWPEILRHHEHPSAASNKELLNRLWRTALTSNLGLSAEDNLEAESWETIERLRSDGVFQRLVVAQLVQSRNSIPVDDNNPDLGMFTFRGGTTLIIDSDGRIRFSILKPFAGAEGQYRLESQRRYLARQLYLSGRAPYKPLDTHPTIDLRSVHRGY